MPSAPIYVIAGALPLLGASAWLMMCGLMEPRRPSPLPRENPKTASVALAVSAVAADRPSVRERTDDATSGTAVENAQSSTQARVDEPPTAPDGLRTVLNPTKDSAEDEASSMDDMPLPPPRPRVLKVASPTKRMRNALALLSKKVRSGLSAMALVSPNVTRTPTDAIAFFQENPPRLIDIFSIPK